MSNGKTLERLWKLQTKINMMVMDGQRDPSSVSDALQSILDEKFSRLTTPATFILPAFKSPQRLKDTDDVYLWEKASPLFNGGVSKLPAQKKRGAAHVDLVERLNDFEIIKDLGGEKAVMFASVGALETTIGQLIANQAGGKSGDLLNDGKANIFYVRDPRNSEREFSVHVRWDSCVRKWYCHALRLDDLRWFACRRAFSATAA